MTTRTDGRVDTTCEGRLAEQARKMAFMIDTLPLLGLSAIPPASLSTSPPG